MSELEDLVLGTPLPHFAGGETEAPTEDGRGRLEAEGSRKPAGTWAFWLSGQACGAFTEEPGRPSSGIVCRGDWALGLCRKDPFLVLGFLTSCPRAK